MNGLCGGEGITSNDCKVHDASTSTEIPESLLRPCAPELDTDPASAYEIMDRNVQLNYHQTLVTADAHVYSRLSLIDEPGYVTPGPPL